jgi:hypothetical protein
MIRHEAVNTKVDWCILATVEEREFLGGEISNWPVSSATRSTWSNANRSIGRSDTERHDVNIPNAVVFLPMPVNPSSSFPFQRDCRICHSEAKPRNLFVACG